MAKQDGAAGELPRYLITTQEPLGTTDNCDVFKGKLMVCLACLCGRTVLTVCSLLTDARRSGLLRSSVCDRTTRTLIGADCCKRSMR